ncbi:phage tail length tape measure family protein [Pararhizobium sp. YC-54]|uniref:phage tail length tape measure family protein n=1 Tax=Pararhizobium sp. YC-54 TaxID=2986920 RepID=UPI0021F6F305|nr:phage tail length tape measure family protein [Pararhizobium sp. YC-54]MCV9997323.1 phage tail length tape measure family protein [Pararhizobium sp. YC-54]
MTVALRSLRVTAGMDAREYLTGMNQKIAADRAGAASSAAVGAALARTDAKANQSGGVLTKLSRQYVDGYGGAARFEAAISSLGRGVEKGAVPLARVETILEGIYRKYNLTANAAELMASGQLQLASAVTNVNAKLAAEEAALDAATLAHKRHGAAANDNRFQQRNLMFQLNDVFQSLALGMPISQVALQQGPQIAQIYGPGEGGIGRAFSETGKMIGGVIAKFPVLTGATVLTTAAFAGMTYEINQTTKASVGFGDVALASLQVLGKYISEGLQPAISAIAPWFETAWNGTIAGVKWVGNAIINSFHAAYEDIKFVWANFPTIFAAVGKGAANGFIAAIEWLVQKSLEGFNKIIAGAQAVTDFFGISYVAKELGWSGKLPTFPKVELGRMDNPAAEDFNKANSVHEGRQREIMNSDPLGGFYSDVRTQAIKNAQDDDKKKGGKNSRDRESDYERAIRRTQEQTKATAEETRVIDLSTYARERQGAVQDILTAAQRDGLEIGKAFANAQDLINASSQSLSPALETERQRILDVAGAYAQAQADAEKAEEAKRSFEENLGFAKDVTRGFIDDFRGAIKDGATIWEAFGDAALSVLDKISDKLLNDVLDAIFKVSDAGASGGGGGIFGLLASGIDSLFGGGGSDPWAGMRVANAKGNVFNSPSLSAYSDQVVDRPTYFAFAKGAGVMGEAGPEGIFPLRRDASGRLGITAANSNQGGARDVTFNMSLEIKGTGDKELLEQARQGAATQMKEALKTYDQQMPDRVKQINSNPRKRVA